MKKLNIFMPDFAKVMAAAILLLAGLFVLTSQTNFFISPGKTSQNFYYTTYKPATQEEKKEVKEKTFEVGMNEEIKHISIANDVVVSFKAGRKILLSEGNITIKNGFGGRKAYEKTFSIKWPETVEKAELEIEVHDTNLYGNLLVFLNNELIYENLTPKGKITIPINVSQLKEKNKIMIFASSSGWRLWAPTTYILSFNLTANFFNLKKKELPFVIGEEAKTLKLLRFVWFTEKIEGEGNLVARFNGKEIYRGREKAPMIDLDPKDFEVKQGNNILELYAEKNTSFHIKDIEAILFYQIKKTPSFTFNITEDEYAKLSKNNATFSFILGKIYGDVVSISLKIIDGKGKEHRMLLQGLLREGEKYEIKLTKNELKIGENKIIFKVSGDGWIIVRNAKLSIGE